MKKIFILTSILIVSFTSMSFRECSSKDYWSFWLLGLQGYGGGPGNPNGLDNSLVTHYTIYVGDNGTIYRSSGETNIIFEQKTSGTTQRLNYIRVTASNPDSTVLAVGNNGTIVRSVNRGNNWNVTTPVTASNLYGVDNNNVFCFAVGDNGALLYSPTGGATWVQLPSPTTRNLKAISMNGNVNLVVVGEKGTIMRTTDGTNWTNLSIPDTTVTFNDISQKGFYFDGSIRCIVGSGGRIYKSTDNGATFVQKPSGTTNNLRKIYFHTIDSAVVVGDNGTIRFTTNGGESWFTDPFFNSPSTRNYKSVSLVNLDHKTYSALSDTIFFVSDDPITLGLEQIGQAVPMTFTLSQNYPNPFNPNTKIKFQVAKLSDTKLIVYDALGKEVETLVNGKLNAGSYEADFDGTKLPSGVYFYKLISGDFSQTKKMILIK